MIAMRSSGRWATSSREPVDEEAGDRRDCLRVVVLGVIVYSTMNLGKYRVRFAWRSTAHDCRTASADTEEHALRTATSNACGDRIRVTDSMACEHRSPDQRVTLA